MLETTFKWFRKSSVNICLLKRRIQKAIVSKVLKIKQLRELLLLFFCNFEIIPKLKIEFIVSI